MIEGRREFLRVGLTTTALGLGCFRLGLREVLAEAKREGKPVLTHDSLNKFLIEYSGSKKELAKQFEAGIDGSNLKKSHDDVMAWFINRFMVTEAQKKFVSSLTGIELDKIRQVAQMVAKEPMLPIFTFHIPNEQKGAKKPKGGRIQISSDTKGEAKKRRTRVDIHCGYD